MRRRIKGPPDGTTTEEYAEQNATDLFIGLFDGAWFRVEADKFQNPMNTAHARGPPEIHKRRRGQVHDRPNKKDDLQTLTLASLKSYARPGEAPSDPTLAATAFLFLTRARRSGSLPNLASNPRNNSILLRAFQKLEVPLWESVY